MFTPNSALQSRRVVLLIICTCVLICSLTVAFFGFFFQKQSDGSGDMHKQILKVALPLQFFKGQKLLDPQNLNYIYEYYLLENLGSVLLREDAREPGGYRAELMEGYQQESSYSWAFVLKRDLRWSDGSLIQAEDLAQSLLRLSKKGSRHHLILNDLQSVDFDESSRVIRLRFSQKVEQEDLLHELSLADASLLHPRNFQDDWTVSSGHFFVEKMSSEKNVLTLKANPYLPVERKPEVQSVELRDGSTQEGTLSLLGYDMMKRPPYSFQEKIKKLEDQAKKIWLGHAITIYYFYFGKDHLLTKDLKSRQEFSHLVALAYRSLTKTPSLFYEEQIVPEGFSGRLKSFSRHLEPIENLRGKTLKLVFDSRLSGSDFLTTPLLEVGRQHGVQFEIEFSSDKNVLNQAFAVMTNFVGNQKSPLGSWSFLYSEQGSVGYFREEAQSFLQAVIKSSKEDRFSRLMDLHKFSLDQTFLVPFMCEQHAILASERVDLSALNPFDQRMRFFEVKWN
ncbi:MAG: hypothetical protein KA436_03980 [Oligoflexales bacterium]|nr:hypothetical protein [Oligoflexales bacterium]